MPDYSIWMLEESNLSISGGRILDGVSQGDGSHLVGATIRLNSDDWLEVIIRDGGDSNFDDNDSNQRLLGAQSINGTNYASNAVVEGEYTLTLEDEATGETYTAVSVNVRDSDPSYATVEGLSFVGPQGGFPPVGIDLRVIAASEGPGSFGQSAIPAGDYAFPVCFTPGVRIETAAGPRPIETLAPGDLIVTRDRCLRPLRWLGSTEVAPQRLVEAPAFRPVRINKGALGPNRPNRDLVVSQQHRILLTGWRAELLFGEAEVLTAAVHLIDGRSIRLDQRASGVTYLHLLFDRHEVIYANRLATESFFPGPQSLCALDRPARAEVLALYPELRGPAPIFPDLARTTLRHWESALLTA
ncbi:MAG: Hint domain-containing protein [Pseudomonadota bacterium]